jgi:hypothetical protein
MNTPPSEERGAYAFQFMSQWFYNITCFGGRGLPAPVAEIGSFGVKTR